MKKLLFICLMCIGTLGFIGCSSPEKKAKSLIDHQLKVSLHDYSSYENVEFGKLDSTFSDASDLSEYKDALDKVKDFNKQGGSKIDDAKLYGEIGSPELQVKYARWAKSLLDSATYYLNIVKRIDSTFVPEFVGWNITHTFRANNASGNKIIVHRKYNFDKDITQIVKDENLDEE